MIAPRYLLDTDTFVYIRRGRPAGAQARFQRLQPGQAVLSVITYGELIYGIAKKKVGPEPLLRLEELTQIISVIPLTREAAAVYGAARAALSARGEMIGANDLWIAAHAISLGLILVTNNEREFKRVPDLKIENWTR
ncbi:MAG TPA: PIN domain-containing protein [Xanthobacteraceae bacterium]|nr:PIN domain-containing protein [Xanthobacteraceae bacterium]